MKGTIIGTYEGLCADANITNLNGLDITREVWENVFASDEYKTAIELPGEVWKDIPAFESLYQVSSYGRIRSKDRVRIQLNRYCDWVKHKYKGKLIKIDYSTSRFGVAHLYDKSHKEEWGIYPLVCCVFGQEHADRFFYGTDFVNELEDEIWRPIPDYPEYEVSNQGRVLKHMRDYKIMLKPWTSGQYLTVNLSRNNSIESWAIHRLVAIVFVPNPDLAHKIQVNHIDGNKLNNVAANLEWVTPSENMQHAYRTGLCTVDYDRLAAAQKLGSAKVSVRIEVPELDTVFDSIAECARRLNLDYDNIVRYSLSSEPWCGYTFIRR